MGIPLLEAIEQTSGMRAGGAAPPIEEGKPALSEADLAKQNEASMRELQQMMGGLGT